jgi:cellulose synthase (UDP-forming)
VRAAALDGRGDRRHRVETVTEDAHTALKLHRHGYTTAYLAIPQAAGLATESLTGHIGQRIRWARGMTQIFRIDNPLFGRGLTLGQRLCYLNAMMHFFYGIPRLVFLTAPLSFLFFGAHVIHASATMLALYALPHVVHATLTNSRMQSRFRHSFWAEVYEAVLASYIALPTLLALVNPRLGKFNVTAKGGRIDRDYFDWAISKPYLSLLILNAFGLAMGALHIALNRGVGSEVQTTAFNLAWTTYNLLILGLAVAAANERRQVRESHRVAARMPVMLRFGNGRTLACETLDYSEGGMGVALPEDARVPDGEQVTVSLFRGVDECGRFRGRSSTRNRGGSASASRPCRSSGIRSGQLDVRARTHGSTGRPAAGRTRRCMRSCISRRSAYAACCA